MAYSIQNVSKTKRSTRPKTPSTYKSALEGFSSSINDIRKQLLSDQSAMIDYEIEIGTASVSDKINLYEQYLSTLVEGSNEWVRVANKLQSLEDQADSVDFSLVKKLYQTNQVDTSFYYNVLKQRAVEPNLSQQEKQTRLLELASFEKDVREKNTDQAIRDSSLEQSLGLITAADRYALLEMAMNAETDPDRKRSLQVQLVNQAKEVRNEDLSVKELLIRKGIQEGTASKSDLLGIYALKLQTALTPEEALRSEIQYQDLVESINNEQIALAEKGSKAIVKNAKSEIGKIDNQIALAKQSGEITKLSLLYAQKTAIISQVWDSDAVTLEDKDQASFKNFFKDVLGKDVIDLEAGIINDVAPTDDFNLPRVLQAVSNPDSSALVKTFDPDTNTSTYDLVRGTQNPDGTYTYGDKNVVIGNKRLTIETPASGPTQDGSLLYGQSEVTVPDARRIEPIPNYEAFVRQANQTPFRKDEIVGQAIVENLPIKNEDGTITYQPIKQYVFEGERFKDYAGFEPIPGQPNRYTFISPDGTLPTEEMLQKKPESLSIFTRAGAFLQETFNIPGIDSIKPGDVNRAVQDVKTGSQALRDGPFTFGSRYGIGTVTDATMNAIRGGVGDVSRGQMPSFSLPQVNVPQFQLPDFGAMFSRTTSGIGKQLLGANFSSPVGVIQTATKATYNQALQSSVDTAMQNQTVSGLLPTAKQKVQEFATNVANNVRSTFNNIWRF